MRNAGLDEAQAGIKSARRNINNLRYADDTTRTAESEEAFREEPLLMKVQEESEKGEKNTGTNLPAQIELYAEPGDEYELLFVTKGGGSANKSFLFQETRAVLNPKALLAFLDQKIRTLGTAACPPYHLAIVIGGTSAELTLQTVKLASTRYLDGLPP